VLITRVFAVSVFGLALATGALAQTTPTTPTPTAPSGALGVLRSSIPTGSQVKSPTGHVRRAWHSTGRASALAALRGVPGTFERA
jgi:hypothetical protein